MITGQQLIGCLIAAVIFGVMLGVSTSIVGLVQYFKRKK